MLTRYLVAAGLLVAAMVGLYTVPPDEDSRQFVGAEGFPRRPHPQANYVQGPVLVSGIFPGEWWMFMNAGNCCYAPLPAGPGWEGQFAVHWPLGGGPQWVTIAVANDFGDNSELHEWEMSFMSPLWWSGQWWVAYVSTDDRTTALPHCERVRLGLARAYTATGPWERNPCWFQLPSIGVWSPSLTTDSIGRLWLHWREVDCNGVTVNYSRRLADLSLWESEPQFDGPRLRWIFEGESGVPQISDVAWDGRDQRWVALDEGVPITGNTITEWYDSGPGMVANTRLWRKTGLTLESTDYALWDASYVRSALGHVVYAKTMTALCGDGRNANFGGWELCLFNTDSTVNLAPELYGFGPITVTRWVPTPTPTPTHTPTPTATPTTTPTPRAGTIRRRLLPGMTDVPPPTPAESGVTNGT